MLRGDFKAGGAIPPKGRERHRMPPKYAKEVRKLLANREHDDDGQESEPQTGIPATPGNAPVKDIYVLIVREEEQENIIDSTASDLDAAPLREGQTRPSVPVILSMLALSLLIAIGVLTPYQQPEQRASIRVPAVLLPLKTFHAAEPVMATGVKTYAATPAHGILTITNGSVIAQELPAGLIFTGADGIEITTDEAVFVPAGSASGYGVATVSAHTLTSGKSGNISALDIDSVEGSSVYIRNLRPFAGGHDATSVKFASPQDRQIALDAARRYLAGQVRQIRAILENPCSESTAFSSMLRVTWVCRFAAYPHLPGFHITGVRLAGKTLVVDVVFAARPRPFPGK